MPKKDMANVPAGKPATPPTVAQGDDPAKKKVVAGIATSPLFNAAVAESAYVGGNVLGYSISAAEIHSALVEKFKPVVRDNDMSSVETMLLAQAHTCDVIFNDFARRAHSSDTMAKLEAYLRMALKAQQQSAMTLRILGELKSPKQVAFIKQANVANGPQQVNNGTGEHPPTADVAGSTVARAHEKTTNPTNELLENRHGERLDTGAASSASGSNQTLEAVGAVHRAEDSRG
jgi:hypothetical protein